jgi:hypothetical protein
MCEPDVFRESLSAIEPIRMRDPLATLLGAFHGDDDVMEYRFTDVLKMAGHGCPTVSMAFVACKHAVRALFPDGIGVRGSISVLVHGERDDGVFGVMAQVFSLITGAGPETGFKGLGGLHRRNNLLRFGAKQSDEYLRFDFTRTDTKRTCAVTLIPGALPSLSPSEQQRLGTLLTRNIWEAATESERTEFRDLWSKQVRWIALEEKDRNAWLTVETREV